MPEMRDLSNLPARSTLNKLLDQPAYFDPIDRIEGAVSTFINADWKHAAKSGLPGILAEIGRCILGQNSPTLYVARDLGWRGIDIERLLFRHGVKLWDRGIAGDNLYFCVKRRQVKWAEYLLLRAGVPVTCDLKEPRNRQWTRKYDPGSEPPSRRSGPRAKRRSTKWSRSVGR